ncbi:hypothetical protein ISF_09382 [Cordyceps fumosorosea ARSEF 2679]|uniref:Uncharacterized protein n=1 Tax=Cordyceps fumosorosea (strain ARSEF 2679) TaxID=1081104 RepID=A0A167JH20_CORFA|nr:hypothetical protein ISF_09382 [Cordyceps fumosorosea ARSEF 2679]OAA50252.1 hypothetical protein ISF_09382 [Cordyceps fumosorosea ARSEF 2679]
MDHFKTVVELTGVEQLCFNCRALLDDEPKHRIHGHLLCDESADIVSLLRVHNWRVCLVCALAGEADDIDCADIQNFLDKPNTFVKQYDRRHCPVCDDADDPLFTPCGRQPRMRNQFQAADDAGHVVSTALALVAAQSTFLVREHVEVVSRSGRG